MVRALLWCARSIERQVLKSWRRVPYTAWFCVRGRRRGRSQSSKASTKRSHQRRSRKKKQSLKLFLSTQASRLLQTSIRLKSNRSRRGACISRMRQLKKPSASSKKKTPSSRKRNGQGLSPRHSPNHFRYLIETS